METQKNQGKVDQRKDSTSKPGVNANKPASNINPGKKNDVNKSDMDLDKNAAKTGADKNRR